MARRPVLSEGMPGRRRTPTGNRSRPAAIALGLRLFMMEGCPISRLTLTDFRSYQEGNARCRTRLRHAVGDNGASKTNLLEAVSLSPPARAAWGGLSDMARQRRQRRWGVAGRLGRNRYRHRHPADRPGAAAGAGQWRSGGRQFARQWQSILWLTPAMDVCSGQRGERRRFLDRLVLGLDNRPTPIMRPATTRHAGRGTSCLPTTIGSGVARFARTCDGRALALPSQRRGNVRSKRSANVSQVRPRMNSPGAAIRLDGWLAGDLTAALASNPEPRFRRLAGRSKAPTDRTSSSLIVPRRCPLPIPRPASKRRCCSARPGPCRTCRRTPRTQHRSSSSTKWRRISTRGGARRCSRASKAAARCG